MAGYRTLFDAVGNNAAQVCKTGNGHLHGLEVSNPTSADA